MDGLSGGGLGGDARGGQQGLKGRAARDAEADEVVGSLAPVGFPEACVPPDLECARQGAIVGGAVGPRDVHQIGTVPLGEESAGLTGGGVLGPNHPARLVG